MTSSTATFNDFSGSSQLVPAEVNASIKRTGDRFLRKSKVVGSTIDREGLTNNYAVEPVITYAAEDSDARKARLGVMFAIATWVPVAIAVLVS